MQRNGKKITSSCPWPSTPPRPAGARCRCPRHRQVSMPYDDSRHLHPHWHCVCLRARWRCPCGPRRRHPTTCTGQTRDQPPRWRCACLRWRARCECGLAWWRASMPACHADQQPPSWRWSCPITRPAVQADHCATTHEQSPTLRAPRTATYQYHPVKCTTLRDCPRPPSHRRGCNPGDHGRFLATQSARASASRLPRRRRNTSAGPRQWICRRLLDLFASSPSESSAFPSARF